MYNAFQFYVAESGGIEKEWIVVMKDRPGVAEIYSAAALQNIAFDVAEMTKLTDVDVMDTFTNAFQGITVSGMSKEMAREFTKDKRIDFVGQNFETSISRTKDPALWDLNRIDEHSMPLDKYYARIINKDGSGVHAYIIDTGIVISHNEFKNTSSGRRANLGTSTIDSINYDFEGY